MANKMYKWFLCEPNRIDSIFLSLFTIALTWQPFYLYQTVNLFELGLYLPGIDGIFHGQVPYRDFFYLRGPFELYMPAFLMRLFGEHLAVLSTYFYIGTVITLIVCVLIACKILPARLYLYCFVPVLIGRTFPRVVFTYWGGMRYAWGLLGVLCLILFFKKDHKRWLFGAGLLTAISGLTSIEIGVSVFVAAVAGILFFRRAWRKAILVYLSEIGIIALPYFVYLVSQGAWVDYINSQWMVTTQMMQTFLRTEVTPTNPRAFLFALANVTGKNFRQMTPFYCYLVFIAYLLWRRCKLGLDSLDYSIVVLSVYGLMLYFTAFRTIWQNVFEMALQPEKIVLFYLLTRITLLFLRKGSLKKIGYALIVAIIVSSLVYCISRFSKRFFVFWRDPFKNKASTAIDLPRIKGMVILKRQADDFIQLKAFVDKNTSVNEPIWMYPELGSLHFILDRPWIGKFPTATLAWVDNAWFDKYMEELRRLKPHYAIFERESPQHFSEPCYSVKAKSRFKEQMSYLEVNYSIISSTPTYDIYIRKN